MAYFEQLKDYKSEHGDWYTQHNVMRPIYYGDIKTHSCVFTLSTSKVLRGDGFLGTWVERQRQAKKNGRLSDSRTARLDSIGFWWGKSHNALWDDRFRELVEYKEQNGHCDVKESFGPLGTWARMQRQRKATLSGERIKKLNSLGFKWRRKNWPLCSIAEPGDHDCLVRQGGKMRHHSGNQRYQRLLDANKGVHLIWFTTDPPSDWSLVARHIVSGWRALDPPGRFLEQDSKTKLWNDVGDKEAYEETSQALQKKKTAKHKPDETPKDAVLRAPRDDAPAARPVLREDMSSPVPAGSKNWRTRDLRIGTDMDECLRATPQPALNESGKITNDTEMPSSQDDSQSDGPSLRKSTSSPSANAAESGIWM